MIEPFGIICIIQIMYVNHTYLVTYPRNMVYPFLRFGCYQILLGIALCWTHWAFQVTSAVLLVESHFAAANTLSRTLVYISSYHKYVYIYMYVYIYVYVYICICICICMYVCYINKNVTTTIFYHITMVYENDHGAMRGGILENRTQEDEI